MSYAYTTDKSPMCKARIVNRICDHYSLPYENMKVRSRKQHLVTVRLAIVFVIDNYFTKSTLKCKGNIISRDHATVKYLENRLQNRYDIIAQKVIKDMTILFSQNRSATTWM